MLEVGRLQGEKVERKGGRKELGGEGEDGKGVNGVSVLPK